VRMAEEGISVATKRRARLAECRAAIILARALEATKIVHSNHQVDELNERARRLIEETGARAYEALLCRGQASPAACSEPEA